ncbi:hypothetical protein [Methylorubrum populi]|uniref:hypothetical protein n=1 Tax=Methylorubrum populi TaxID=223967 RepID=UPI000DB40562|nr:hypothetical protein [Methylorubrum populi]PZP71734.1 MAG: hypothetical protein DI590_05585 [Methylorubrum populi]
MSGRLPHTISNQSLTFFVKGKPYSLTKGHEHFEAAKNLLQSPGSHPVQQLIDMVDARQALLRDSHGALQIIGADLVFKGRVLEGLWVDKIKQFRAANEPFAPLFNALGSLVQNPTQAAIDRLPVFLEKSNLGFLEDGRFIAYKAVLENYFDIHTGNTFRNMIGDTPHMPRDEVDANPNSCCSTGLHVGTPEYVKDFGLGHVGRRVMLIAVWPHDVVSVPYSYDGTKMRICAYEVIDELDELYAGTILGRPVITPRTQIPAVPEAAPAASLASLACVGDFVTYSGAAVPAGTYRVDDVDDEQDDNMRVGITYGSGGIYWLQNHKVTKLVRDGVEVRPVAASEPAVEPEPEEELSDYEQLKVGDVILYQDQFGTQLFARVEIREPVQVRDPENELIEVSEDDFHEVVGEVTAAMLIRKGSTVQIDGHSFLQPGTYTIAGLEEEDGEGLQDDPDATFWTVLVDGRRLPIRNRDIVTATHEGEQLWPRTQTVISPTGDTIELTSLDGHDLRQDVNLADLTVGTTEITDEMVREVQVENVEVGQKVEVAPGAFPPAGIYPVVAVYHGRVQVQTEFDGIVFVNHSEIVRVVTDA